MVDESKIETETETEIETRTRGSKITATDRKEFKSVLEMKIRAVKTALNGNLFPNTEDLIAEALKKNGINNTPDEIYTKIDTITEEIRDIVDEHMQAKKDEKEEKKTSAKEEINKAIRALEETYIFSKNQLKDQLAKVDSEINSLYSSMENDILMEFAKEKFYKKNELLALRSKALEVEENVQKEINEKNRFVNKFKYRIESSLNDIANEVQEMLVTAETRQEAALALKKIPTAIMLIQSCQSSKGVVDFMNNLNPDLALPMPEELKPINKVDEINIEAKDVIIEDAVTQTN